jgi:hypothetical protein
MAADDEAFPWDRLGDASDKIGPATKACWYKNTAAGYAIAAVHVAFLREANVQDSIRPTSRIEHPFGIVVSPVGLNRAREIVGGGRPASPNPPAVDASLFSPIVELARAYAQPSNESI